MSRRMDRIGWMSLMALMGITGCTVDNDSAVDTTAMRPIALTVYTAQPQGTTRADAALLAERGIPDGQSIGVYAYYHQGTDSNADGVIDTDGTWADTDVPNFMFNQQATYSAADDALIYAPLKYWPNIDHDKVSFFAYYPYTTTVGSTTPGDHGIAITKDNDDAGLPAFVFTVSDDITKQVDFLMSDLLPSLPNSTDAIDPSSAAGRSTLTVNDRVRLLFHHATSKVTVRIVIADSIRQDLKALSVSKLELTNIYRTGTLTPTYAAATGTTLGTSTGATDSLTYTLVNTAASPVVNYLEDVCLMLPQPLAYDENDLAKSAKIKISYSLTLRSHGTVFTYDDNGNPVEADSYTYSNTALLPLAVMKRTGSNTTIDTWEANHHYIYTIRLGLRGIEFTGQVVDWGDTDLTPIDLQTP